MSYVMAEIAVQRLFQYGIQHIRSNREVFDEIFAYQATHPMMVKSYGPAYVNKIWEWLNTEKIPVMQAFQLSAERVPCYSIHLSTESEDESKAAISDFYGDEEDREMGVNCFSVNLDIGIHGSKVADQVLWMYYIASDIMFRHKDVARSLGLEIQTYSATDWQKDAAKMPENIWTRWIRMRCTVFNTWEYNKADGVFDEVEAEVTAVSSIDSDTDVEY